MDKVDVLEQIRNDALDVVNRLRDWSIRSDVDYSEHWASDIEDAIDHLDSATDRLGDVLDVIE